MRIVYIMTKPSRDYGGIRIPGEILLVKSETLGFGVRSSGIQLKEYGSTDKDCSPTPGIRNPRRGIRNPRLYWIPLHGAMITW